MKRILVAEDDANIRQALVDLLSGETVATDAASFDFDFASPDTRIFEMVTGRKER